MELGVCYYPEHWPETKWESDAKRMRALGLSWVRIAEFAWSRIEPDPGRFSWDWLDRAVETLGAAGLRIVMCTPTATPPKWLIDAHPDVLAVDHHGQPRRFGSRRHYCFSSETYLRESRRITRAVAERYGRSAHVHAWQTDNEFGCHDTILSYSSNARLAFRLWLAQRYQSVDALNRAWGTVFWSQEYRSFEEIDPPFQTVTEANPSHRLDWRRFASDEVVRFNRAQTDILRELSPGRPILHNFMGVSTDFDHFKVSQDLDAASWDSYPLGFLEQGPWSGETKSHYMRQGHPDFTAFHHDLYRGAGRGRWWVMEQQPGPVNWAPFNPSPLPGMVRAWTWEAFAHGAEVVSYFRWRQAPFAQEQMHAGLNTPDDRDAPAFAEVRAVAEEIPRVGSPEVKLSRVALLFDYEAKWLLDIQPQGRDFDYFNLALEMYTAARRLGLDIDVVGPDGELGGVSMLLVPSLPMVSESLAARLAALEGSIVFGPRSGSKTRDVQIPPDLPPGPLKRLLPLRVNRVESLRPGHVEPGEVEALRWLEEIETDLAPELATAAGRGLWYRRRRAHYLATWPTPMLLDRVLKQVAMDEGLAVLDLPDGLRLRRRGDVRFAVNYSPTPVRLDAFVPGADRHQYVIGGPDLGPAGVAAWRDA